MRRFKLNSGDLEQLRNFTANNLYALEKVFTNDIEVVDFEVLLIPGGRVVDQSVKDDLERRTNALIAGMKNCRNKDEKRKVRNKYKYRKHK